LLLAINVAGCCTYYSLNLSRNLSLTVSFKGGDALKAALSTE
jgi:hypothetical protein